MIKDNTFEECKDVLGERLITVIKTDNGRVSLNTINNTIHTVINRVVKVKDLTILSKDAILEPGDYYVTATIANTVVDELGLFIGLFVYRVLDNNEKRNNIPVTEYLPYQNNISRSHVILEKLLPSDYGRDVNGSACNEFMKCKLMSIMKECEYIKNHTPQELITDPDSVYVKINN